jgi:hypothetical protein
VAVLRLQAAGLDALLAAVRIVTEHRTGQQIYQLLVELAGAEQPFALGVVEQAGVGAEMGKSVAAQAVQRVEVGEQERVEAHGRHRAG